MQVEATQAISRELTRDERLLWSGRPSQGLVLRGSNVMAIPFSLLWAGFAFFWEYQVVSSGNAPVFFALWGVPFMLMGLYVTVGRFFVDSYQRGRTFYGLTTERVVIVSGIFSRKIESLSLRNLPEIRLSERSNGNGSIEFGASRMPQFMRGSSWPGVNRQQAPTFDLIENARQVYNQVRDAQRQAA